MIPIITTNAINCNKQASVELGHNGTITYQYDLVNSVARLRGVEASEGNSELQIGGQGMQTTNRRGKPFCFFPFWERFRKCCENV